LTASHKINSTNLTPKGGKFVLAESNETSIGTDSALDLQVSDEKTEVLSDEYVELQLHMYRLTLLLTAFAVVIAAFFFGKQISISLLVGALSGILYIRLLARGIGKLGKTSRMVSKVQLIVPVLLVLAVSKLPELDIIPSLIGFFLYKPSLVIQFLLQPSAKDSN